MKEERIEQLVREVLAEFRRYRRGRWISRVLGRVVLVVIFALPTFRGLSFDRSDHSALIDLEGIIGVGGDASAERINEGLRSAFENNHVKGIILRVNSPGGSPVQARQINEEIDRLQKLHPDVPVYAVVEEICASGGYYVAVAADEIFADPASIVGSIGVRLDSFGFVDAIDKLGVERRLITAGRKKGVLDPFLPLSQEDQAFAQGMLDAIHRQFIQAVEDGRGERLKPGEEDLYSGLFWAGEDALRLGLVDGFGTVDSLARDVIGAEKIVNYTPELDVFDQIAREIRVAMSTLASGWTGGSLLR